MTTTTNGICAECQGKTHACSGDDPFESKEMRTWHDCCTKCCNCACARNNETAGINLGAATTRKLPVVLVQPGDVFDPETAWHDLMLEHRRRLDKIHRMR